MISSLRPSSQLPLNSPKSKIQDENVWSRPSLLPPCTPVLQRSRGRTPSYPKPQPARTLHDGGQICRVGGHRQVREERGNGRRRRLHSRRRNGCAAFFVALLVGRAIRAADARGLCCDLNTVRSESEKDGHTTSRWNFSCRCLEASCCLPNLGLSAQGLPQLNVVSQPSRSMMGLPNHPRPTYVRSFSEAGNMGLCSGRCPRSWRQRWLGGAS